MPRFLKFVAFAAVVAGLLMSVMSATSIFAGTHLQNDYCIDARVPDGADRSLEQSVSNSELTWWPLGVRCSWYAEGGGVIEKSFGWPLGTAFFYGGFIVAALGMVLAVATWMDPPPSHRRRNDQASDYLV